MRLIGLNITKKVPAVTKLLEEGWYPFGDYSKPTRNYGVELRGVSEWKQRIYRYEGLPAISVNCIVGKNGAGKSTLLDMVYRIINNFTCTVLGQERINNQHGRTLEYARGVYAELFFEIENCQCCICCEDTKVTFFQEDKKDRVLKEKDIIGLQNPKDILSDFFYTISTNYSIYSFNEDDYSAPKEDEAINGISGSWIKGLFHKNDGYLTPIVITPFRSQGSIDVAKENGLARQRIVALSILSKAQGLNFIDGYEPVEFTYALSPNYQERINDYYLEDMSRQYKGVDCGKLRQVFSDAWNERLLGSEKQPDKSNYGSQYETALFYLGYKSLKICMTYDDYWKAFGVDDMLKRFRVKTKAEKERVAGRFDKFIEVEAPNKVKAVVKKMQDEIDRKEGSHITLKIEVCLRYIRSIIEKGQLEWSDDGITAVGDMVEGKNIATYNDAVRLLPPPFFDYDIRFVAKKDADGRKSEWKGIGTVESFTISQMSSGERQMLNMMSYVLYHIKNIQSIEDDDNRVKYKHICLIFDEAELYFHPDYQRRFLAMLLESLQWCHIDTEIIRSIQILIVTHSPFVLSDMLRENMMYIEKGVRQELPRNEVFGANLYQLMTESFFFNEGAMGKVASKQITEWIRAVNDGGEISEELKGLIGDPIIRNYLTRKMEENKRGHV